MEVDYREIGRNIRIYRMRKKWKQKELAERVNVTEQHISHIENARTQLSLPTLVSIANALEVDCNTLLGESLTGARMEVMRQELGAVLADIGDDVHKMRLCVAVCRVINESGS